MRVEEGNLCFICDEFLDKYGIKYSIMENKGSGNKRPAYFCFRDSKEKEILWFIGIYKTNNGIIKVPKVEKTEVLKKAKEVLRLTNLGKVVTLTNLPQFLSEIKRDAKRRKIFMNIQETYIPYEIDWGEPQGKEIWWN